MKAYRRRFMMLFLALSFLILLVFYFFLNTLLLHQQILSVTQKLSRLSARISQDERHNEIADENPGRYFSWLEKVKCRGENVVVVMVEKANDNAMILTNDTEDDGEINSIARKVLSRGDASGRIGEYYYSVSEDRDHYIIALIISSFSSNRMRYHYAVVILIFMIGLSVFVPLSLWLSKISVRLMEEAIEREKQFMVNISHDLKTPLTVIKMNNTLIARAPQVAGTELVQWTESTEKAVGRMQHMIGQMMEMSALEQKFLISVEDGVDISEIVRTFAGDFASVAAEKSVALILDHAEERTEVRTDADYASRIVAALLDNAIKYEPDGGEVIVSLHAGKRGGTELEIRNKESRIDPEDIDHVFDRFWRSDKARSSIGYGLGLPIAKKTAELMGAEITARSGEEGTVFTVVFPN